MPPKATTPDAPTSRTVAANVAERRDRLGLSLRECASRLAQVGHPISFASLRRLEAGERTATVDDLTALAIVLGTTVPKLLIPKLPGGIDEFEYLSGALTGVPEATAQEVWFWLTDRIRDFSPDEVRKELQEHVQRVQASLAQIEKERSTLDLSTREGREAAYFLDGREAIADRYWAKTAQRLEELESKETD